MPRTAGDILTLAIETSNPAASEGGVGSVALGVVAASGGRGGGGAGSDQVREVEVRRLAPHGRHDDALMPAIDEMIRLRGVRPVDVQRIAVSIGPGGFTGVRIAVVTAIMLGEATGAEVIPVPSALVALWPHRMGGAGRVAVALCGKRDSAWVAMYDVDGSGGARARGSAVMTAMELAAAHAAAPLATIVADDHLPAPMRAWAGGAGVEVAPPRLSALHCLEASAGIAPVAPINLAPIYPREPEAVRKWRDLRAQEERGRDPV